MSDELAAEGLAREVVNRIQGLRREQDLDVVDRITVRVGSASPALRSAIESHTNMISGEVLADAIVFTDDAAGTEIEIEGETLRVSIG